MSCGGGSVENKDAKTIAHAIQSRGRWQGFLRGEAGVENDLMHCERRRWRSGQDSDANRPHSQCPTRPDNGLDADARHTQRLCRKPAVLTGVACVAFCYTIPFVLSLPRIRCPRWLPLEPFHPDRRMSVITYQGFVVHPWTVRRMAGKACCETVGSHGDTRGTTGWLRVLSRGRVVT